MRKYTIRKYQPKRRYRKRRKSVLKSRIFWDSLLGLLLFSLIFYFLFFTEVFKIKKIKILCQEIALKKDIGSFLIAEQDHNFFLVNSEKIENEILEKYPEIEWIKLRKIFPDGLTLEVKQKAAVALFCYSDTSLEDCFLIDGKGIIFEKSSLVDDSRDSSSRDSNSQVTGFQGISFLNPEAILIKIFSNNEIDVTSDNTGNLGKQVIDREKMNQILKINNELRKNLNIEAEKFLLKENKRLNVVTGEGWEIYFDLREDIDFALTKLRLLLEKEIPPGDREGLEYIDLRFSKVYYK